MIEVSGIHSDLLSLSLQSILKYIIIIVVVIIIIITIIIIIYNHGFIIKIVKILILKDKEGWMYIVVDSTGKARGDKIGGGKGPRLPKWNPV